MHAAVSQSCNLLRRQGTRFAAIVLSSVLEPNLPRRLVSANSERYRRVPRLRTDLYFFFIKRDAPHNLKTRRLVGFGICIVGRFEDRLVFCSGGTRPSATTQKPIEVGECALVGQSCLGTNAVRFLLPLGCLSPSP